MFKSMLLAFLEIKSLFFIGDQLYISNFVPLVFKGWSTHQHVRVRICRYFLPTLLVGVIKTMGASMEAQCRGPPSGSVA